MSRLEEQIAALSESDFKRLYDILQSAEQKMKGGYSYSSEIYSLEYEFPFSAADLMDLDSLTALARSEAERRNLV
ncbi:MAG: hypothetical protein E7195_08405 [Peptococcaceae bacterium]|nr:hypothetical protein [Peptococcaceae bacterium]MBQ3509388.1 hypothetical protein [Peptococcaceae bacterium]MBR2627973.1 hypothetical protein [Peptococcaceae bacterium]